MNETALCCENPVADTKGTCVKCGAAVCEACTKLIEEIPVCAACHAEYESLQTMAEEPDLGPRWTIAVLSGLAAAMVCAVIWAVITMLTHTEYGYAAIGLGWLTGHAVHLGSGKKHGKGLGALASFLSIFGLFVANYIMFVLFTTEEGMAYEFFSLERLRFFVSISSSWYTGYDILWVSIAMYTAFHTCKPDGEEKKTSRRRKQKSATGQIEERVQDRLEQFEDTEPNP